MPVSLVTRVVFVVAFCWLAGTGKSSAQAGAAALAGKVTAGQQALEGVLVSAKRAGSTVTVTVVSDTDGRYSFPAARLESDSPSIPNRHKKAARGNAGGLGKN